MSKTEKITVGIRNPQLMIIKVPCAMLGSWRFADSFLITRLEILTLLMLFGHPSSLEFGMAFLGDKLTFLT